ncbi:hypothetical protein M3Y94_00607800 [Aphelenchoides besseyi]|nr:hypothetical protein M3Y94_00607800 [Aphelenchoides besseyi]
MSHGRWPSGQFFEEAYCPLAEQMGLDCREFYSENAARLLVYYGALTWESLDEVPTVSLLRLFNEMSGNLGLWLGLTAVTLGELFLVFIQSSLWCCRCKRELPDVPSFYRPNYPLASPHFDALTSRSSSISPPSTVATNEMLTTGNAMKFNNWLIVGEEQVIIDDLLEFPISTHYNSFTLLQY